MNDLAAWTDNFERWLRGQRIHMPPDLNAKAEHAVFTLKSFAEPATDSQTCKRDSEEALAAFEEAYDAWMASQDNKSAQKAG